MKYTGEFYYKKILNFLMVLVSRFDKLFLYVLSE